MNLGVVVIGRNEGDRLKRCLASLPAGVIAVYVDSGSTDGSVALAQSRGVLVEHLDLSVPFTAARARNRGWRRLVQTDAQLAYIQFMDGDCELSPDWCKTAYTWLEAYPDVAMVCGRLRERYPEASLYNQLCDLEWQQPIGAIRACGGNAMGRVEAIQQVGGFNDRLIAGEEPEMCLRLRQHHWQIYNLEAEMAWHDARMTQFRQWWVRSQRAGHAYAEVSWLHRQEPERFWIRESHRAWIWALLIPGFGMGLFPLLKAKTLGWLGLYLLQGWKIYQHQTQQHPEREMRVAGLYAIFCVLGKFPELQGQLQFHVNRLRGQHSEIMEYK
uniref:glycosyltransferase family 2 protein n=1 Tax=Petrachloros mirabilis TaxID=2918835 RepID=UPI001EE80B39|nr:glycosyltransferase [Petrachloros mirabilis]